MNRKTILALASAVLLSLGAVSLISTNLSSVSAQTQSQNTSGTQENSAMPTQGNSTQNGNNETNTAGNVTLQLHAQLDAAIVAAQNNDTLGVLMSLSKIAQGLAEMNYPAGNATEIAATQNQEPVSNQTAGNQSRGDGTNTTTSGGVGTDDPASGSDNPYSDFT